MDLALESGIAIIRRNGMPRPQRFAFVPIFLLLAGCSTEVAEVSGEVAFPDRKAISGGTVVFELDRSDVRERRSYPAEVAADGTFRLKAVPGVYRVMIAPPQQKLGGVEGSARKLIFNDKFSSFETSDLKFEVMRDPSKNHFKIQVTPP